MENQKLQATLTAAPVSDEIHPQNAQKLPTASEIQTWIVSYLAELLEIDADELDVTLPFDSYGLDSAVAVGMTGDLEDWLGRKLDPTLLYDYPTVQSFAKHLAEELETKVSVL